MKEILGKNFVIFLILFFASCSAKKEEQTQIRIVDIQGNPHSVVTKIPPLNMKALASQGKLEQNRGALQNAEVTQNSPENKIDYGAASSEIIQETLQMPQKNSTPKPIEAVQERPAEKVVEYSLSEPEEEIEFVAKSAKPEPEKTYSKKNAVKKSEKKTAAKAAVVEKASGGKKFFVQVGSFLNKESAQKTLNQMKKFHAGKVSVVEGEKTIYRALLGPFANRNKANAMVSKVTGSGHEAILVRSN